MKATLILMLIISMWSISSGVNAQGCARGCVIGGRVCTPLNLCPDGRPFLDGECVDIGYHEFCVNNWGLEGNGKEDEPDDADSGDDAEAPKVASCEAQFQDQDDESFRRVLFVDGNLEQLFREYRSEAELRDFDVDLKRLEIIFFATEAGGGRKRNVLRWGREVKLTLGELVRGYLPERAWGKALGERMAISIPDAQEIAEKYSTDLYCG